MKTPFLQLNLSSVEHACVEYHVAESKNSSYLLINYDKPTTSLLFEIRKSSGGILHHRREVIYSDH
jgi:hypothetical protein